MTWASIGSLSLPFQMQRHGVALRTEMARHSSELTTGRVEAPQRHLRGDLVGLAAVETRLTRITTFDRVLAESATAFDSAQVALDRVFTLGSGLSTQVMAAAFADSGVESYAAVGAAAFGTLEDMLSALSLRVAGRAVFSGAAVDRPPLVPPDQFMATVRAHVAGLGSAAEIVIALEDFFLSPGGGFETALYSGAPPAPGPAIGDGEQAPPLPTASDPAIRRHLMAAAMAALLDEGVLGDNQPQLRALAMAAMTTVESNAEALIGMQAGAGGAQELFEQRRIRLSHEQDALVRARDALIGTDPFQSASLLEETRHRLDMLYAITARVSRLSLLEYLK